MYPGCRHKVKIYKNKTNKKVWFKENELDGGKEKGRSKSKQQLNEKSKKTKQREKKLFCRPFPLGVLLAGYFSLFFAFIQQY